MNYLYLLTQETNRGYDTFDSAIVCAASEDEARLINPDGPTEWGQSYSTWADKPEQVTVKLIGVANETCIPGEVILASFNAG